MISLSGTAYAWPEEFKVKLSSIWRDSADASSFAPAPSRGTHELRSTLQHYVKVAEPFITSGVRAVALPLVARRKVVVFERPTFLGVVNLFRAAGRDIELHDDRSLPNALRTKDAATAACWVTSPGRNPDGRTLNSELDEALHHFRAQGGLVIRNATNGFHSLPSSPGSLALDGLHGRYQPIAPGEILVGSFSKLLGPWARLGWVAGEIDDDLRESIRHSAPALAVQHFWTSVLSEPAIREALAERSAKVRAMVAEAAEILGRNPGTTDGSSLMLPVRGEDPVRLFANYGLEVNDGRAFAAGPGTIRLSFLGVERPERAYAALKDIRASIIP